MNAKSNLTVLLMLFMLVNLGAQDLKIMDNPKKKPTREINPEQQPETEAPWYEGRFDDAKLTLYKLDEFAATGKEVPQLKNFEILQQAEPTKAQIDALKGLLNDPQRYLETDHIQQCFFMPSMGIELQKGDMASTLLFSFKCHRIRIYDGEKYQTVYTDPTDEALEAFYQSIFPPEELLDIAQVPPTDPEQMKVAMAGEKPKYQAITYQMGTGDQWESIIQHIFDSTCIKISLDELCFLNQITRAQLNLLKSGDCLLVGHQRQ